MLVWLVVIAGVVIQIGACVDVREGYLHPPHLLATAY